jgi:biotin carboxylase
MSRLGGSTTTAMKGLMIASAFTLPYHVLRTASAAGLRVHVLGSGAARGLRWSRHCRAFHESRCGGDAEALLAEIRDLARRHSIEVIFPADDVSTRLLASLADRLPLRCTPLPDLATFDLLNDKWSFTQFCRGNGIRAPEAWLFDSTASLRQALDNGEIALPVTVKPTNRSGGFGVLHIRAPDDIALLDDANYSPLLAQRYIVGESVSITLLCERGRVVAHVGQQRDAARFRVLANSDLLDNAGRLALLTDYDGTVNFDAIVADADGLSYLVECNPRFWYSIYLVMIAGLNFIGLSLANPARTMTIDRGELHLSWRKIIARPWRATRLDWKFLAYNLGDPVAYLLLRGNSYDDSDVAVPVAAMAAAPHPAPARLAAAVSAADFP